MALGFTCGASGPGPAQRSLLPRMTKGESLGVALAGYHPIAVSIRGVGPGG